MALPLIGLASSLLPNIFGIASEFVEDKDKKNELKQQIEVMLKDYERTALKGQIDIIVAEAKGKSWMQRNWRPGLMWTIILILANNNLFAPWFNAMFNLGLPALPLAPELYAMMTVGIGGYIGGRTYEKVKGVNNG